MQENDRKLQQTEGGIEETSENTNNWILLFYFFFVWAVWCVTAYFVDKNRVTFSDWFLGFLLFCPQNLKKLLPKSLTERINNGKVKTIHIPFRERIISKAIEDYNHNNFPTYNFSLYTESIYNSIYRSDEI